MDQRKEAGKLQDGPGWTLVLDWVEIRVYWAPGSQAARQRRIFGTHAVEVDHYLLHVTVRRMDYEQTVQVRG